MFLFFLLRSLLTTVLRRTQKHRSKKRSGAAQENPPFASCMTRHATALDAKHASAALPASAAASGGGAPRKALLAVLRMARGGDRVDKRGLPERNKAKASMQKKPGKATTDQRKGYPKTKGRHAYLVQN